MPRLIQVSTTCVCVKESFHTWHVAFIVGKLLAGVRSNIAPDKVLFVFVFCFRTISIDIFLISQGELMLCYSPCRGASDGYP